jgi:Fe-S oxidoreductase
MELLNMMRRGAIGWTSSYAEALYGCMGCKLCQEHCLHRNDVAAALFEGRRLAVEHGCGHPALERFAEQHRSRNDKLRTLLRQRLPSADLSHEAQVALFPGSDAVERSFEDIEHALAVFRNLELDFVRVMDAPVVSSPYELWASGHRDATRFACEELLRYLRNFATLIVNAACDTHFLRVTMRELGFDHNVEIVHITEYLASHTARLPIKRQHEVAYYHDSCYLVRHLGIVDAPRRLLGRCVKSVREYFHNRERAECCGGGALVPLLMPDATKRHARTRLDEPRLYGVPLLIAGSTECKLPLQQARIDAIAPEVQSLINVLAWSITG